MRIQGLKVLVTGGAGFIGSHIVDDLVANGADVRVFDNFSSGTMKNLEHLKEKVDIVFANEEEALAFTGKEPGQAITEIAAVCDIAVVKIGKAGSIIQSGEERFDIASIKARPLDTTGAGDNYAAGFFYGLSHGFSLAKCGRIAALVSGKTVEVMGAKLPKEAWPEIMHQITAMD